MRENIQKIDQQMICCEHNLFLNVRIKYIYGSKNDKSCRSTLLLNIYLSYNRKKNDI